MDPKDAQMFEDLRSDINRMDWEAMAISGTDITHKDRKDSERSHTNTAHNVDNNDADHKDLERSHTNTAHNVDNIDVEQLFQRTELNSAQDNTDINTVALEGSDNFRGDLGGGSESYVAGDFVGGFVSDFGGDFGVDTESGNTEGQRLAQAPNETVGEQVSDTSSSHNTHNPRITRTRPSRRSRLNPGPNIIEEPTSEYYRRVANFQGEVCADYRKSKGTIRYENGSLEWQDGQIWRPAVFHGTIRSKLIAQMQALGSYDHERSHGEHKDDVTSYHPDQKTWGPDRKLHWPFMKDKLLFRLDCNDYPRPNYAVTLWYDEGRVVLDGDNHAIKPYRNIPLTLSSVPDMYMLENIIREDTRITNLDFRARMPPIVYNARGTKGTPLGTLSMISMRFRRFRHANACPPWNSQPHQTLLRDYVWNKLSEAGRRNNSTEELDGLTSLEQEEVRWIGKGKYPAKNSASSEARMKRFAADENRIARLEAEEGRKFQAPDIDQIQKRQREFKENQSSQRNESSPTRRTRVLKPRTSIPEPQTPMLEPQTPRHFRFVEEEVTDKGIRRHAFTATQSNHNSPLAATYDVSTFAQAQDPRLKATNYQLIRQLHQTPNSGQTALGNQDTHLDLSAHENRPNIHSVHTPQSLAPIGFRYETLPASRYLPHNWLQQSNSYVPPSTPSLLLPVPAPPSVTDALSYFRAPRLPVYSSPYDPPVFIPTANSTDEQPLNQEQEMFRAELSEQTPIPSAIPLVEENKPEQNIFAGVEQPPDQSADFSTGGEIIRGELSDQTSPILAEETGLEENVFAGIDTSEPNWLDKFLAYNPDDFENLF